MGQVYEWLGFSREEVELPRANTTRVPTTGRRLYSKISNLVRRDSLLCNILDSRVAKVLKRNLRPRYKTSSEVKSELTEKVKSRLRELLESEYQYWLDRSPNRFGDWKEGK